MALETIKCQECGSADVVELKTGSYVCQHCEALFKRALPAGGVAVGCEIDGCGVTSVGRCFRCGRAFCTTHQARDEQTTLVDFCSACKVKEEADRRAAEAQKQDTILEKLQGATDLDELAALLEAGTCTRLHSTHATAFDREWRTAVESVWQRLVKAGVFGPPSHDIVSVRCHWPNFGKPQRLTFEELSRQPGWLVLDAQPFCLQEGLDIRRETRGQMDVWIAADLQTFRREEVYRPASTESRATHDARLTYYWMNGTRQGPVTVAVPVGEPPRTVDVSGFLLPRETKELRDTILLTDKGSRDGHSLDHDLGTALAAGIRNRHTSGVGEPVEG
jgi:hypothetical protein